MTALAWFLFAGGMAALAFAAIVLVAWLEAPIEVPTAPDTTHGTQPLDAYAQQG